MSWESSRVRATRVRSCTHRCEARVRGWTSVARLKLRAAAVMDDAALRSSAVRARFNVALRTVAIRPPRMGATARAEATPVRRAGAVAPVRGRAAEEARTAFIACVISGLRVVRSGGGSKVARLSAVIAEKGRAGLVRTRKEADDAKLGF